MKNLIRRNLPINENYKLIDSFYTGTDNGIFCENCGKYITNVGVIETDNKKAYHVGIDCAKTLTNIEGLQGAEMNFAESKAIRAKVNKAKKEGKQITVENTIYGEIRVTINDFTAASVTPEFCKKYLPDFYTNISNPEKNGFTALPQDSVNFHTLTGVEGAKQARELYKTPQTFNVQQYAVIVGLKEGKTLAGEFNGSYLFDINIYLDGKHIGNDATYMARDINMYACYLINKYQFDQYELN